MKALALVVGFALLAIGLAGFVPTLYQDGQLFGVLPMDTVRSVVFAIAGVAAIAVGMSGRRNLVPRHDGNGQDMRPWV